MIKVSINFKKSKRFFKIKIYNFLNRPPVPTMLCEKMMNENNTSGTKKITENVLR